MGCVRIASIIIIIVYIVEPKKIVLRGSTIHVQVLRKFIVTVSSCDLLQAWVLDQNPPAEPHLSEFFSTLNGGTSPTSGMYDYMYTYVRMWQSQVGNEHYSTLMLICCISRILYSRFSVSLIMNDQTTCTVNFRATATGSLYSYSCLNLYNYFPVTAT